MNRIIHLTKTALSVTAALALLAFQGCKEKETLITQFKLQQETVEIPAEGGEVSISYTVTNPVSDATIEAVPDDTWLHDFDYSEDGVIRFTADENPTVGQTRSTKVTVSYADGLIETEFTAIQGEGLEKAPFDVAIDTVGMDFVTATITPLDPEMTWHAITYEKEVYEERFDTYDDVVADFLSAYQFIASMVMMDFESFMMTHILTTGTQTMTFDQLRLDVDQYIFVVGLDSAGNRLTDGVLEPFRTLGVDKEDITFDISVDVNGPYATLHTVPSDNSLGYYTDIQEKSESGDEFDLQGWVHTLIWRGEVMGKTREQVVDELSSYGEVTKEYYLNANTEYYAFAATLNEEGIVNSDVEIIEFTTGDILMSDNTFEITITETGADYVHYTITPSNNDSYTYAVSPVADWEGLTDEEYVEDYIYYNSLALDMKARQGILENGEDIRLAANTEYYLFVFGYEQLTMTTDVTKVKFKTTGADNPELLSFEFSIGNVTPTSVEITVTGTPDQALYYWDVIDASATQETAKETLDARVQRWIDIGYKTDRAQIFQEKGVRGTVETTVTYYNFSYDSIEPGKEYKLYAVGIYDETGEYATDFVFSEPFTTPEQ